MNDAKPILSLWCTTSPKRPTVEGISLWSGRIYHQPYKTVLAVALPLAWVASLWAISSTKLCLVLHSLSHFRSLRFNPQSTLIYLTFIPFICTHSPGFIQQLNLLHQLVKGKVYFSRKAMNVPDQCGHDFSHTRTRLSSHSIDHVLCEMGIVLRARILWR